MTTVEVFAPAKINLTLHITGRRTDGYHLIDSLVAFGPVGDTVVLRPAHGLSLSVGGPEAGGVPANMDNLALQAGHVLRGDAGLKAALTKRLPAASGIGGGSADAAAVVRGCLALENRAEADPTPYLTALTKLGADIPMCLTPTPQRARGIGEQLVPQPLPALPAVLVNPRVPVPTAGVFKALASPQNAPMPDTLPHFSTADILTDWLATQRNDLEAPAQQIAPTIGAVLEVLRQTTGCRLARMSGSGATCFGLYDSDAAAETAAFAIRQTHPHWWIAHGPLGDQTARAAPKVS